MAKLTDAVFCPFCGAVNVKIEKKRKPNRGSRDTYRFSVSGRCMKCHARGPVVSGDLTFAGTMESYNKNAKKLEELENQAMEAWNARKWPMAYGGFYTLDDVSKLKSIEDTDRRADDGK